VTAAQKQKKLDYEKYINSSAWKNKRILVLARDGHRCQKCYSQTTLDVHHKTYRRFGRERLEDLVSLCRLCHEKEHRLAKAGIRAKTERGASLRRRGPGECRICQKKFDPKIYPQGGGWYCGGACKKKMKVARSLQNATIIKVSPVLLRERGTVAAIEAANWSKLA
jgi:hypothetical protein